MHITRFRVFFVISVIAFALAWGYSFTKIENSAKSLTHVVQVQKLDRETAVLKNVEARKADCTEQNSLRAGLRQNVEDGQKSFPLLLQAVPQLNTKAILAANNEAVQRELRAFSPINCQAYADAAIPPAEAHKVSLEAQQAELTEQQATLAQLVKSQKEAARRSAESRVTTVTQRCELTRLFLDSSPKNRAKIARSLAGCEKQLINVKREAAQAR